MGEKLEKRTVIQETQPQSCIWQQLQDFIPNQWHTVRSDTKSLVTIGKLCKNTVIKRECSYNPLVQSQRCCLRDESSIACQQSFYYDWFTPFDSILRIDACIDDGESPAKEVERINIIILEVLWFSAKMLCQTNDNTISPREEVELQTFCSTDQICSRIKASTYILNLISMAVFASASCLIPKMKRVANSAAEPAVGEKLVTTVI